MKICKNVPKLPYIEIMHYLLFTSKIIAADIHGIVAQSPIPSDMLHKNGALISFTIGAPVILRIPDTTYRRGSRHLSI